MAQELFGSEKKIEIKTYATKKSKSLLLKDYQETSAALGETYDKIRSCKFRIECYLIHVTKHLLNLLFIT